MARTALNIQKIDIGGLNAVFSAANVDGHSIDNDGHQWLRVNNGGAGAVNVTLQTPKKIGGVDIADPVIAVPAGEERDIKLPEPGIGNQSDGAVWVDFSGVTSVTVAALELK